ncbi:hypothetical protein GEMRC1_002331 [Eukaryota sp. GEM-RC1]
MDIPTESIESLKYKSEIESLISSLDKTSIPNRGFLPLEFFDTWETDPYTSLPSTSALSKFYNHQTDEHSWLPCTVLSYDPSSLRYSIKWENGTVKPRVSRPNLLFTDEDKVQWEERWQVAEERRAEIERRIRFRILAEELSDTLPELNSKKLQNFLNMVKEASPSLLKELESELIGDYKLATQLSSLTYKLKDPIYADKFGGLSVSGEFLPSKPVPEVGIVPVPGYNFSLLQNFIQHKSLICRKDASKVLMKYLPLLRELEQSPLVDLTFNNVDWPLDLLRFVQLQEKYSGGIRDYLITEFSPKVASIVREELAESVSSLTMGFNYASIDGTISSLGDFSSAEDRGRIGAVLKVLNLSLADSLKTMLITSGQQILNFIESFTSTTDSQDDNYGIFFKPATVPLIKVVLDSNKDASPPFFFVPSLSSIKETLDSLFDSCVNCISEVPELAHQVLSNLGLPEEVYSVSGFLDGDFTVCRSKVHEMMDKLFTPISVFLKQFDDFKEYVTLTPDEYLAKFFKSLSQKSQPEETESDPNQAEVNSEEVPEADVEAVEELDFSTVDLEVFSKEIRRHFEACSTIEIDFVSLVKFEIVSIDCQRTKTLVAEKAKMFGDILLFQVSKLLETSCQSVIDRYQEIEDRLLQTPTNPEELNDLKKFIAGLPDEEADIQHKISNIQIKLNLLDSFYYQHAESTLSNYVEVLSWSTRIDDTVTDQQFKLDEVRNSMVMELEASKTSVSQDIETLAEKAEDLQHEGDILAAPLLEERVLELKKRLDQTSDDIRLINSREALFQQDVTPFEMFATVEKDFDDYYVLWTMAAEISKQIPIWLNTSFVSLDPNVIADTVQQWNKSLVKRTRAFKELPMPFQVCTALKDRLVEFKKSIEIVQSLRSPGLKTRHWDKQISSIVGIPIRPSQDLKLQDLLDLNIYQHISKIQEVAAVAGREHNIEQNLDKMAAEWEKLEFELKTHDAGTFILRATDDLVLILDEQIVNTQTIRGSPFIKPFEDRARIFEEELLLISDVIEQWLQVQKSWMYLEPIFCSEDIVRQLPDESKRFAEVNSLWKALMERVSKGPNVLHMCNDENLLKSFTSANESLEIIQKGLSDYLETKRQAFPRFYFLSNDGLLEILSETKDPTKVNPHLRSCFEAIDRLEFSQDKSSIQAMFSAENEKVPFDRFITPSTLIEKWLNEVESVMRTSLRKVMGEALLDYSKTPRTDWVLKWPSQAVLAISQIQWTRGVTEAITSSGVEGLLAFKEVLDNQLMDIIHLVRGDLKKSEQITVSALITIDVHNRDIVTKMAAEGVSSIEDFLWLSQLRYYYENNTILIKQVTATVEYGYEYLGNTARLVITPLTDRCYVTLMSAMQLNLGGAPAGPAGTGKTETTKDLAKALAKQCVVYNCSDSLDVLAMAKFFKGLVASGAWACFDEFNRINLEVLSVIAQQILSIQQAIRENAATIDFEGSRLKVDRNCAVFITMNPGYAGRTELPDNLKALFRPVAMMVPDYAMISEIVLMSFGFENARPLSKKLVSTFQLASEQLSSQSHYDFGMRAVKTVLTAAGALKRKFMEEDEDILIFRALSDVNVPKFLHQDVSLFINIISDLFPTTVVPEPDYDLMLSAINESITENKLQPHPEFVKKVIQLYETVMVRHGLMLVGLSFSGKSSVIKVLGEAMTKLASKSEEFTPVHRHYLNPKSVTQGQLYGYRDELSQEVVDGLIGFLVRNSSRDRTTDRHWVVFDGPVDAVWIESMNTVLDDNKKLCLPSGDIIQLTPYMTMMFEVQDLAVASPATVSRCGMVYCELTQLGWRPLYESWMNEIPEHLLDFKDIISNISEYLIDDCTEFVRRNIREPVKTTASMLVKSFLNIIEALFNQHLDCKETIDTMGVRHAETSVEAVVIFALFWSIGATGLLDDRVSFNEFVVQKLSAKKEMKFKLSVDLPRNETLYDYAWDFERYDWIDWYQTVPEFSLPETIPFHEIIVDTVDTIRYSYILETLIHSKFPVLFTGPTGTSKTVIMKKVLTSTLDKSKFIPSFLGFSARTDCNQVQDIIDGKIDSKRRKDVYGPPLGQRGIIFVDDLNMPKRKSMERNLQ